MQADEVEEWHPAFDRWPVGLALFDGHGSVLKVNAALSEILAMSSAAELDGAQARRLLRASPDRESAALLEQACRGEGPGTWEGRLLDADGHEVWARIDVRELEGVAAAATAPRRMLHVAETSERHLAEQALEAQHVCWREASHSATADAAVAALAPALATVLEVEFAAAWTHDAKASALRCDSLWQAPSARTDALAKATRDISLADGVGVAGRAWESGAATWTAAMAEGGNPVRVAAAKADGLTVGLAVPLRAGDRVLAVIELVGSRSPRLGGAFLDSLTALGAEIGELIARKSGGPVHEEGGELLLVEDDRFVATVVGQMLSEFSDHGDFVHVDRLSAARERLATSRPACVLLDLSLPDADGLEALLEVRALAPDVPIVVLTGQDNDELAVRALREGAQDYLSKRRVDMESLTRAVRYAIERKGIEQLELDRALRDRLTRLPGRILFADRLRVALRHNPRGAVAVVLLNLDRFRLVNDSLGHEAGDALLLELADRIVTTAGPDVTVAGFGGDEFALLVESADNDLSPVELARSLMAAVGEPVRVAGEDISMRSTVGIAKNHGDQEPDTLIAQADTALSRAKGLGGDRWELFDDALRSTLLEQLQTETGLRAAIDAEDQLCAYYQPVVSLEDRRIVAFEALVRWRHPQRGLLAPGAFIGVAEQTGLIVPLGTRMLEQACGHLAEWRRDIAGAQDVHVNVNVSARQLADEQLVEKFSQIVADAGIEPPDVCLEVTETALMDDIDLSTSTLGALKDAGFDIALDDFGTGYSSLSYLQRFPIDVLKLDCSFVRAFRDGAADAIVTAVARMADAMGIPVLAEGVEEEHEVERLRKLGYGLAQGYLFGRPEPAESARSLLMGRQLAET